MPLKNSLNLLICPFIALSCGIFCSNMFGLHKPGKQHVILRKEVAGAKIRLHVQEELPLLHFTQCSPFAYLTYLGLEECFKSPSWSLAFGGGQPSLLENRSFLDFF